MHQHACDWHDKYGQREAPALPREGGRRAGAQRRGHATAHWGPEQEFYQGCLFSLSITLPAFLLHYHPSQTPWGIILV